MSTMDRLKDTRVWDDALSRVLGRIEATANSVERGHNMLQSEAGIH